MKLFRRIAALAVVSAVVLAPVGANAARSRRGSYAVSGAKWLRSQQLRTGAFFTPDQPVDDMAETAAAIEASGGGSRVTRARVLSRINALGPAFADGATSAGKIGKLVLGIKSMGSDPTSLGGKNYVAELDERYDAVNGDWNEGSFGLYANALAALGKVAGTGGLTPETIAYFRANQCIDGGWSFAEACGFGSDTNSAAIVVIALRAAGIAANDPDLIEARTYLLGMQNPDAGFPSCPGCYPGGELTDANSTGIVMNAIAALGENVELAPWRQADGDDPVKILKRLQLRSGAFRYQAGDPSASAFATIQAVPGMAGRGYPIG